MIERLARAGDWQLCSLEQCPPGYFDTLAGMQFEHVKTAILGGWVLALGATAVSFGVGSATGWLLLAVVGLVPPVMLRMWRQPAQTISESIHEVIR